MSSLKGENCAKLHGPFPAGLSEQAAGFLQRLCKKAYRSPLFYVLHRQAPALKPGHVVTASMAFTFDPGAQQRTILLHCALAEHSRSIPVELVCVWCSVQSPRSQELSCSLQLAFGCHTPPQPPSENPAMSNAVGEAELSGDPESKLDSFSQ